MQRRRRLGPPAFGGAPTAGHGRRGSSRSSRQPAGWAPSGPSAGNHPDSRGGPHGAPTHLPPSPDCTRVFMLRIRASTLRIALRGCLLAGWLAGLPARWQGSLPSWVLLAQWLLSGSPTFLLTPHPSRLPACRSTCLRKQRAASSS
jgi:hypothetical protein